MSRLPILIALLAGLVVSRAAEPHRSLPPPVIPDCLGVNIHFTDPKPGEIEMLAAAGFKWVRMDFSWAGTERKKGEYDFSAYDRLVAALDKFKIRAVFILDYGNPLYAEPGDAQPFTSRAHTPEFREAFGQWAVAAVRHFQGRGYLWEMWNEPNGGFWKSPDKTGDYIALAKATGEALRRAGLLGPKGEAFIGPATSTIDLPYLEACFQAGLLDYWDAVSVHPYRQSAPETVEDEYRSVRLLIRKYAPKDKAIPIISGEWGYSSAWPGMGKDETARAAQQAKYLPRQFLTDIANDIALSIWYDWHDDGTNPKEGEYRFGIVGNEYHAGRDPVYDPKPAYAAMKTLSEQLGGFRFNKRLGMGREEYFDLLFEKKDALRPVVWKTVRDEPMQPWIEARPGKFATVDYLGQSQRNLSPRNEFPEVVDVPVSTAPLYLVPQAADDVLRLAAAWDRAPLEIVFEPGRAQSLRLSIRNPLDREITLSDLNEKLAAGARKEFKNDFPPSRDERVACNLNFGVPRLCRLLQTTYLVSTGPLRIVPLPVVGAMLPVRIENPSGNPLRGQVEVYYDGSSDAPEFGPITLKPERVALNIKSGQKEETINIPLSAPPPAAYCGVLRVYEGNESFLKRVFQLDELDRIQEGVASVSVWRDRVLQPLENCLVAADGDQAVASRQTCEAVPSPAGISPFPARAVKLSYRMKAGWRFVRLSPPTDELKSIHGVPESAGWWIFGDAKGCVPRIRFTDRSGQCFQASGPKIDWKGWQYVIIPIRPAGDYRNPVASVTHWGGSNDGLIDSPIKWDSIFLLDNVSRQPVEGEIYLSAPTLIY